MKINLIGQTGSALDTSVLYQKTQNWYPSIEQEGKNNLVLYPTPALTAFTPTPTGPIRGSIVYDDKLYVVSAAILYEVSSAGALTSRGTLSTTTGRVAMAHNGADNGTQIAIADGTHFYIWDSSGTPDFKIITNAADPDYDADCPTPTVVAFFDGYFIINDPSITGRFYISSSYDGTAWDALDFATAERDSDKLQNIVPSNRLLWMIGEYSAEAWHNANNTDFPFEPVQSGYVQYGTPAPFSAVEMDGSVFFLAQSKEGEALVLQINGMTPSIISSAINADLASLTTYTDAYAWTYQYNGHAFYVLTFPTDERTFVYDILTQMWHEWSSYGYGYHRSSTHSFVYNKHIIGDTESGRLFYLDWSSYTDDGARIERLRRCKSIHAGDKTIRHAGVWVDFKEAVGNSDEPDPDVILRYKDNNGAWSNEKWRKLGKIGEYNTRVIWRNLGRSRDRVYEIKITDPVNAIIVDAYVDILVDEEELR